MLLKSQRVFSIIGFLFFLNYSVYVGGYSTAGFFKYSLLFGTAFFTLDLFISFFNTLSGKDSRNIEKND
jgi:hypothetical protein